MKKAKKEEIHRKEIKEKYLEVCCFLVNFSERDVF
jgi:hypothetical protein